MKVRDVMTYGVISVPESASIAEAVETMLRSRVSALFVFDADHALSGVLSEGDLLRRSELGSEPKRPTGSSFSSAAVGLRTLMRMSMAARPAK